MNNDGGIAGHYAHYFVFFGQITGPDFYLSQTNALEFLVLTSQAEWEAESRVTVSGR